MTQRVVPVIDVFAGPGGLSEGFSAGEHDGLRFDVRLSIEKDAAAHSTLLLRAFYRQFPAGQAPDEYYAYLKGEITRAELFKAFPDQAAEAANRSLHLELGPNTARRAYSEIERALGKASESEWVLIGGPPCQAYSVAGRSRRAKVKREEFERDEKHVLYREYLRILARYAPPVFVMENVKGLLSATLAGASTFKRILSDLSCPDVAFREPANNGTIRCRRNADYTIFSLTHDLPAGQNLDPARYVVQAECFGVPQKRHRVILLGVRCDLTRQRGSCLRPSYAPVVKDLISDLPAVRSRLSDKPDNGQVWKERIVAGVQRHAPDIELSVREEMLRAAQNLCASRPMGGRWVKKQEELVLSDAKLRGWLTDPRMAFTCNHETRCHMDEDLIRYLFVACYAEVHGVSPKLQQFPASLLPEHKNVAKTIRERHGNFNDRFRVQLADRTATTVTSHIAKDGHYFIHHDTSQCRSWTVREAARIQTFPDNYFFEGSRTEQYAQVGNAVPPYLAAQIAEVVARVLAGGL